MKFKLEYIDKEKMEKFIKKKMYLEIILLKNYTYASISGLGGNNSVRSSNKIYKLNKKYNYKPTTDFVNNNAVSEILYLTGDTLFSRGNFHLSYYEEGVIDLFIMSPSVKTYS